MEKQLTIDDYLNSNNVAVMNTAPAENYIDSSVEKIEAEPVDYNNLKKEELLVVLADKDNVINNYISKLEDMEVAHKSELENLNHFYSQRTTELSNLVQYYERKLRVLKDIINIETGGER